MDRLLKTYPQREEDKDDHSILSYDLDEINWTLDGRQKCCIGPYWTPKNGKKMTLRSEMDNIYHKGLKTP